MKKVDRQGMTTADNASVTLCDSVEDFDRLRDDWERLYRSDRSLTIFSSWSWLRDWWRVFGEAHSLRLLVVRQDHEIVGIAPLMLSPGSRITPSTLRFIGHPDADYADFIAPAREPALTAVMDFVRSRTDWQAIQLNQIPESSPSIAALQNYLQKTQYRADLHKADPCFTFVFEGDSDERRKFRVRRSKSLRNQINFFAKRGGLDLKMVTDAEEILAHLPRFFQFHIARWHETPTPSYFRRPGPRAFFESLVKSLAPQDKLFLLALVSGSLPVAYFFCFRDGHTAYLYTPAHNPYFERRSPGKVLNYLLLEKLVKVGFRVIDYTRGGEQYKLSLTNKESFNYSLSLYRRNREEVARSFYTGLKKVPPVRQFIGLPVVQRAKNAVIGDMRQSGVRGLLTGWLKSAGTFVWNRTVTYEITISGDVSIPEISDIRELSPDDLEQMGPIAHFDDRSELADRYRKRFDTGWKCFGMVEGTVVTAFVWGRSESSQAVLEDLNVSNLGTCKTPGRELLLNAATRYLEHTSRVEIRLPETDRSTAIALQDNGFGVKRTTAELRIFGIQISEQN